MDATDAFEARATGNVEAVAQVLPLVYDQLRAVAAGHLRGERPGQALRPTELVHEAYLRLVDRSRVSWQGKTHFLAVAAIEMRRILVDSARARGAAKRWGALHQVTFDEGVGSAEAMSMDVLAVHEALERLVELNPRQAKALELGVFGGLGARETSYVLEVSERTVKNDLRVAKAWLRRELSRGDGTSW